MLGDRGDGKGQISLEFMILYSFVITVFVVIFALIASQRAASLNQQEYASLQLLAQDVSGYLNQALYAGSGYNATIPLVGISGATSYNITISSTGVVIVSTKIGSQVLTAYSFSSARTLVVNGTLTPQSTNAVRLYLLPQGGVIKVANHNNVVYVDTPPAPVDTLAHTMYASQTAKVDAAVFNGTSSYAVYNGVSLLDFQPEYTISAWIYLNGSNPDGEAIYTEGNNAGAAPTLIFGVNQIDNLYFCAYNSILSSGSCLSPTSYFIIPQKQWTFVAAEYNGGTIELYIGNYSSSPQYDSNLASGQEEYSASSIYTGVGFNVGNYVGAPLMGWNGMIANLQVYNSTENFQQMLDGGVGASPIDNASLQAWYQFNGNGKDNSGNGYSLFTSNVSYVPIAQLSSNVVATNGGYTITGLGRIPSGLTGFIANNNATFGSTGSVNSSQIEIEPSVAPAYVNNTAFLAIQNMIGQSNATVIGFNYNTSYLSSIGAYQKLVGWWPLVNNYGAAYDLGSNHYNLYPTGSDGFSWIPLSNNATNFQVGNFPGNPTDAQNTNGQNNWMTVPASSTYNQLQTNGSFTAVMWVHFDGPTPGHWQGLFGNWNTGPGLISGGTGFQILANSSSTIGYAMVVNSIPVDWPSGNPGNITVNTDGNWTMVVGQYNGNTGLAQVLLNTEVFASNYVGTGLNLSDSTPYYIGNDAWQTGGLDTFNGLMSNVQLYSTYLNSSQINYLYRQGVAGAPLGGGAGIVGWWPLSDGTNDLSFNKNNGTVFNSIGFFQNVQYSHVPAGTHAIYVANFTPQGDNALISNGPVSLLSGNTVTISAWIRPVRPQQGITFPAYTGVLSYGASGCGDSVTLGISQLGIPEMSIGCGGFIPTNGPLPNFDSWNFLAGTINGTKASLFLNGVWLNGTLPSNPTIMPGNIIIGSADLVTPLTKVFNGSITDVQVYNAALSPLQIEQMYEQGMPIVSMLNITATAPLPSQVVVAIASGSSDAAAVISTQTNTAVLFPHTGKSSIDVTVTPNGQTAYITNYNSGTVSAVNPLTGSSQTISIGTNTGPYGLAITPNGQYVVVADYISDSVSVIATSNNMVVATIPLAGGSTDPEYVAITPDGQKAYVSDWGSSQVSVINLATDSLLTTISVGASPAALAVTPDGSLVFVTNEFGNSVSVIDTATDTVVKTIGVGTGINANPDDVVVTPNGAYALVTDYTNSQLYMINVTTLAVQASYGVSAYPVAVVASSNSKYAYTADGGGGAVSKVELGVGTLVSPRAGVSPVAVALSNNGDYLYSADEATSNVVVLNTTTMTVIRYINVGQTPFALAVT